MNSYYRWNEYRDIPEEWNAGDTVSMSDLVQTDRLKDAVFVRMPLTLWGDYVGTVVERSNYQALLADFPDRFVVVEGFPGAHELIVPLHLWSDELQRIASGLQDDYPLYDEMVYAEVENQLVEESWEAWVRYDLVRDLDREHGLDTDELLVEDDTLQSLFFYFTYQQDYGSETEGADNVHYPFWETTVAAIADHLKAGDECQCSWCNDQRERNGQGRMI